MTTAQPGASDPADGIDLVDEQDARTVFLGRLEHVANAAGTHANEHLDEFRARDRVERHTGLTSDCPPQQRLAGARRTDQQNPLGNTAPKPLKLLRVFQELDDLIQLALGVLEPGNLLERRSLLRFIVPFGRALDEAAKNSAVKLVTRAPHHQIDKP